MLFGELSNKVIVTISGGQRRPCPHCLHLVHMHFYKEPLFEYHIKKMGGRGGEGRGQGGGVEVVAERCLRALIFFFKSLLIQSLITISYRTMSSLLFPAKSDPGFQRFFFNLPAPPSLPHKIKWLLF